MEPFPSSSPSLSAYGRASSSRPASNVAALGLKDFSRIIWQKMMQKRETDYHEVGEAWQALAPVKALLDTMTPGLSSFSSSSPLLLPSPLLEHDPVLSSSADRG